MKNKYINYLAVIGLALGASSCVDMDLAPLDQKSDATMWQTANDVQLAVNDLYGYLPEAFWGTDEDVYTDNAVHGIKWAVSSQAHGQWIPTNYSWSTEYVYIRSCNLILENASKADISQTDLNTALGTAYFFRALIYSDLIRQFGDVPLILEPLALSDQEGITRTSWETVYNQVMSDYDNAISMLPNATGNSGYVSAMGARAFKAKTALYFANPECPHYISGAYQVVVNETQTVINSGQFNLYDEGYTGTAADYTGNYESMFWGLNINNSNESLLTRANIAGQNGSYYIGFECYPTIGWGGTNPTQSLVDAFEDCYGAPIDKSAVYNPLRPWENRDPRLATNVIFSGQEWYGLTVNTYPLPSSGVRAIYGYANACGDATLTGYQTKKWLNPDVYPETDGWDHSIAGSNMRFTEVLLMFAEAKNELSGLDPEAFAAVNRVRARVGMPALQNSDPSSPTYCASQDDLRQRIRNEFRVEFCFEGNHRQWDARRWNIAMDVLNADRYGYKFTIREDPANALPEDNGQVCDLYVGEPILVTDQIIRYNANNYVYPIPQDEIDLNPNITQNPGYD
ncbi:MAG: RagB/SusD family nutrient uptake outer membrane protein [Muribaculaceae bacterium]|nr:RagB/SusD family nutrient uptake outer membrane protein [Muribaculaceae bacterium]